MHADRAIFFNSPKAHLELQSSCPLVLRSGEPAEPEGPQVPEDIMLLVNAHPEHGDDILDAYETLMAEK